MKEKSTDAKANAPAIFAPTGYVSREEHETLKAQRGACVWLTGLSSSGKTSIARALQRALHARNVHTYALDGDMLRGGLCKDLPFTQEGREENIRRAGEVAQLMVDAGLIVTAAFISPYREGRALIRERMPRGRFIECHVSCPLTVCEARDTKGLYARARAGELDHFTGISAPYEAPEAPDLKLETAPTGITPEECAMKIIALLEERGLLSKDTP